MYLNLFSTTMLLNWQHLYPKCLKHLSEDEPVSIYESMNVCETNTATRNSSTVSPVSTRLSFSVNQNSSNWPWKWVNFSKTLQCCLFLVLPHFPTDCSQSGKSHLWVRYVVKLKSGESVPVEKKNLHFVAVCFAWRCVEVNYISVLYWNHCF